MHQVFVVADNIVAPLGATTAANFKQVCAGVSGISRQEAGALSPAPFHAAVITPADFQQYHINGYTKFEQLVIRSMSEALQQTSISLQDKRTLFVLSTTKGNISLLEESPEGTPPPVADMELSGTARRIGTFFNAVNTPVVVSNACISGLLAILTAQRLIRSGLYDHAVVTGADVMSRFVLSGFQSFLAVSPAPCRPFDADRSGVTLGEGAATVILSRDKTKNAIVLHEGAVSNDANHISGPSRTGAELGMAMQQAVGNSHLQPQQLGFVSAHGTATLYNDEMEAKALHFAGLQQVPVNSIKGFYGHTLGAAGILEAIIGMEALKAGVILPTPGFKTMGVSMPVNVSADMRQHQARYFLKTVSGFGGCNAAMVFGLD